MAEPTNTPVVSASQSTDDAPLHRPPRPTNRRTKSMVRESMPTQSTEREGSTTTTGQHNENEVPLFEFLKKKKTCSCKHLRFVFD